MSRSTMNLAVGLALVALVGCDTGSRSSKPAATAAGSTATTPGAVNVLPSATPAAASSATPAVAASTSPAGGAAPAATSSPATSSPAAATAVVPAAAGAATPAAVTPSAGSATPATGTTAPGSTGATTQPQIFGTIPPDPTTGFDGTLYLVGERFVPGSIIAVAVNGVPTKVLPATFYSSELLGVYVYFTVSATYTFSAVAPDGTASAPVTFTVPDAGTTALLGLNQPQLHMVYPPSLDTSFSGTVWLMGDQFMPGCVGVISVAGVPVGAVPLVFLNERTVGWVTATPLAGDLTIQVSNPTLLTSQTVTLTVGAAPTGAGVTPQVSGPSSVASPFLGSVHLFGSGIEAGAVVELRVLGGAPSGTSIPLIRVSPREAWWTLAYPLPGSYEYRVVNPSGAAGPWQPFDVR